MSRHLSVNLKFLILQRNVRIHRGVDYGNGLVVLLKAHILPWAAQMAFEYLAQLLLRIIELTATHVPALTDPQSSCNFWFSPNQLDSSPCLPHIA